MTYMQPQKELKGATEKTLGKREKAGELSEGKSCFDDKRKGRC